MATGFLFERRGGECLLCQSHDDLAGATCRPCNTLFYNLTGVFNLRTWLDYLWFEAHATNDALTGKAAVVVSDEELIAADEVRRARAREATRKWREENPDRWREKNAEYQRRYQAKRREKVREARRRMGLPEDLRGRPKAKEDA